MSAVYELHRDGDCGGPALGCPICEVDELRCIVCGDFLDPAGACPTDLDLEGEERCVDCGDRLDPDHVCWLTTAEWDRLRGVV